MKVVITGPSDAYEEMKRLAKKLSKISIECELPKNLRAIEESKVRREEINRARKRGGGF